VLTVTLPKPAEQASQKIPVVRGTKQATAAAAGAKDAQESSTSA